MDQVQIGKFIAQCRREQDLTQAALAEKLGITDRAVSKWETGKSLPDSSIMLELCELLSINVNELLKGERIMKEEYARTSEELILDLKRREEEKTKFLLQLEIIVGIIVVAFFLMVTCVASLLMETAHTLAVGMIVAGTVLLFVYGAYATRIEQTAGYYECPECGHKHIPTFWQVFLAPHFGRTRKMTCPACGKRSYQKKVLN